MTMRSKPVIGVRAGHIEEMDPDDVDYELSDTSRFFSSNANLIPLANAVQAPRVFYGARFVNQALPLVNREAPLVQSLRPGSEDRSFDDDFGEFAGGLRSRHDAEVQEVRPGAVVLKLADGSTKTHQLYNNFVFNSKSGTNQTPVVVPGAQVKRGDLLATSNYTDDKGTLAMGVNARIGLIPYKGWSMDDAIAISESFANRLKSEQMYAKSQEFDEHTRGGRGHFTSLFPEVFTKAQLANLDDNGVAKVGTTLRAGDPMILATAPRVMTSRDANVGKLSRTLQHARKNASQTWDYEDDGVVTDVAHGKGGTKVVIRSTSPTKLGDKITLRSGGKSIVSAIIPDDRMLRTTDGQPLEVLLNPLSLPSRVNSQQVLELALGKIAKKIGRPIKVPAFNPHGTSQREMVDALLAQHGVSLEEETFDPEENRKTDQPISVGYGYFQKLHHLSELKASARGSGSFDQNGQPSRGSGEHAQAKRVSGLENAGLMSAGAYATQKANATLRGAQNDEFFRQYRMGATPPPPGEPFVWKKFLALLGGAGLDAHDRGGGRLRLGPMTDKRLAEMKPVEVRNGELVDTGSLEPIAGGLFDPGLVGGSRWGQVTLPMVLPNPSMAPAIKALLGITERQFEGIIAGRVHIGEDGKVIENK